MLSEIALDRLQDFAIVIDGEENGLQGDSRALEMMKVNAPSSVRQPARYLSAHVHPMEAPMHRRTALGLLWTASEMHYRGCVDAVAARSQGATDSLTALARQQGLKKCTRSPF